MFDFPMKSSVIYNQNTIGALNRISRQAFSPSSPGVPCQNIPTGQIGQTAAFPNRNYSDPSITQNYAAQATVTTPPMSIPHLLHPIQKGQKIPLSASTLRQIDARLGWNAKNSQCDIDVSAFLLGANGKVLGDDWFVFYGQPESPDKAVVFFDSSSEDREHIRIDFTRLNPAVQKIVFVLTINDALAHRLNFGMVQDAYIRIMDMQTDTELVSFEMTDYYSNVISMMIGEVYQHKGVWKCNAVGNGVNRDLAGLCELYGVQVC